MVGFLKKLIKHYKDWKNAPQPAIISIKNIKNYIQAEYRMYFKGMENLETHIKEQVLWRSIVAKPCTDNKSCLHCGCSTEEFELYMGDEGCKKEINPCFPKMMDKEEWEIFKKTNKIKINDNL